MTYVTTTITTIKNKPSSLVAKAVEGIMQEPRVFTDGDEQSWKFGQNNLLKSNNKKQRMKLRTKSPTKNANCQPIHYSVSLTLVFQPCTLSTTMCYLTTLQPVLNNTPPTEEVSILCLGLLLSFVIYSSQTTLRTTSSNNTKPTHHLGFLQDLFLFHSVVATNQMFFVRLCYK